MWSFLWWTNSIDFYSEKNIYRPINNLSKPERFSVPKYKSQLIPLKIHSLS